MSTTKHYVITNELGMFWTGSSWTTEYPVAKTFTNGNRALSSARRASENGGQVKVISNYGMEDESVLVVIG